MADPKDVHHSIATAALAKLTNRGEMFAVVPQTIYDLMQLPGKDSNLDKENQNLIDLERNSSPAKTYDDSKRAIVRALTKETENDPDLAIVNEAWPDLPEPIRKAIMAIVETASKPAKRRKP